MSMEDLRYSCDKVVCAEAISLAKINLCDFQHDVSVPRRFSGTAQSHSVPTLWPCRMGERVGHKYTEDIEHGKSDYKYAVHQVLRCNREDDTGLLHLLVSRGDSKRPHRNS